jgi:hypothetical protein
MFVHINFIHINKSINITSTKHKIFDQITITLYYFGLNILKTDNFHYSLHYNLDKNNTDLCFTYCIFYYRNFKYT